MIERNSIGGYQSRYIKAGSKCRVYRNLNNKCFSLLCWEKNHKFKGKVIAHVDSLELRIEGMASLVSLSGQKRVRREKKKNVHAYLIGFVTRINKLYDVRVLEESGIEITYDPYRHEGFVLVSSQLPINNDTFSKMIFCQDRVFGFV